MGRKRPRISVIESLQLETELQNIPEEAAPSSPSFSVSEKLARYGSSALSGVKHLRLLVGKDSIADALLRHFGSLKRCLVLRLKNCGNSSLKAKPRRSWQFFRWPTLLTPNMLYRLP
jgi:hypothetical protein